MPELPEVETVMRGLKPALEGRRLARVEARRPDLRWPLPENFADRLTGRRVERLARRAKYILAELDDGMIWITHLGMSGRMYIRDTPAPPGPHDHIVLETDVGRQIVFQDHRRFGMMDLASQNAIAGYRHFVSLGPEPLEPDFDAEALNAALSGRNTPIKAALLDQKVVAGLGNIYVCEALFRAGISPRRRALSVAGKRAVRLVPEIKAVLNDAIAAGGSSLRDYVQSNGELGYFQHDFRVYGREGEPCRTCERPIQRIVQSGRSTFFCGHCQR